MKHRQRLGVFGGSDDNDYQKEGRQIGCADMEAGPGNGRRVCFRRFCRAFV